MAIDWKKGKPEDDGKYLTACLEPEDKESLIVDLCYFSKGDWECLQDRADGEYAVIYWATVDYPPMPTTQSDIE